MKKVLFLSSAFLISAISVAQNQVKDPYPGYNHTFKPDWSLMRKVMQVPQAGIHTRAIGDILEGQLPDHFNNADYSYFPPIFSQGGYGSCGVSSHVGYMMTSEMNCYNQTDASLLENQLTPMFEYPFTYYGPGKDEAAIKIGFPNGKIYGGRYESSIYGGSENERDDWAWVQGYETFFDAMHRRVSHTANFPKSVGTPEGREAVKWYLYNHSGDPAYGGRGGICCIGVGIGTAALKEIGNSDTNRKLNVVGQKYILHWKLDGADHAMTLVGYDDRIEFDLDNNGKYGEENNSLGQNEKGAWIIANTWGSGWGNKGFIYCPYAMGGPVSEDRGNGRYVLKNNDYWRPYVYFYRGGYSPKRTVKVLMSYIGRSEISVKVGVAQDTTATKPEAIFTFPYINYTGDGVKDGKDAKTPMLGKWADGKMHYEPMEFGIDVTDLSANFDTRKPLKYFLIVDRKPTAEGKGGIHKASVLDYEFNKGGNEVPFDIKGDSVSIEKNGKQTILSVIMPGESLNAPINAQIEGTTLSWTSPKGSAYVPQQYNVYKDDVLLGSTQGTSYQITQGEGSYTIKAVYNIDGLEILSSESNRVSQKVNSQNPYDRNGITLVNNGFVIPDILKKAQANFTIEFWLNPSSVDNWNQTIGAQWGSYLIHANAGGTLTAGWNLGPNRANASGALVVGKWRHYAIVVEGNKTTIYVNGNKVSSIISQQYSGFPALGNLVFGSGDGNNKISGSMDEVRIWSSARTEKQIKDNMNLPIADPTNTEHLLAYLKMDTYNKDGRTYIKDWAHGHDAYLSDNGNNKWKHLNLPSYINPLKKEKHMSAELTAPEKVYVGVPTNMNLDATVNAYSYEWSVPNATPQTSTISNPTFVFNKQGNATVTVKVKGLLEGEEVTKTVNVNVLAAIQPSSDFIISAKEITGDDRISFVPLNKAQGCKYKWEMPTAVKETATTMLASATYTNSGEKTVRLTVTSPNGQVLTTEKTFTVLDAAPKAAVTIEPAIVVKGNPVSLKDNSSYHPTDASWRFASDRFNIFAKGLNTTLTPTQAGIYDLYYVVSNKIGTTTLEKSRALVVCNADSKNGLTINGEGKNVTATLGADESNAFTIDYWFNPTKFTENSNGIYAYNGQNQLSLTSDGKGNLILKIGAKTIQVDKMYIKDEWHHYAITVSSWGTATFYRDGIQMKQVGIGKDNYGKYFQTIRLGKSQANEANSYASYDEFRIWNKALSVSDIHRYAVAPIESSQMAEAKNKGLRLYFQFNQSAGNVKDEVTGNFIGIRSSNFGPDGDAWIDSKGVFALSFGMKKYDNVITAGQKLNLNDYRVVTTSDEELKSETKPADFALDDNSSTFWHSRYSSSTNYPHSITLSRANKDIIKAMSIVYSRGDNYRAGEVNVEQSADGKNWELVDFKRNLYNNNNSGLIFSTPLTKKFIRLTFLKGMVDSKFLAINELNFYGEPVASDKEERTLNYVSVSDQETNNKQGQGANAVDDNLSTAWWSKTSTRTDYPHSIVLQPQAAFDILYLNFENYYNAYRMNIYVSDNKEQWHMFMQDVRIPFNGVAYIALDQPVTSKYVKIEFTKGRNFEVINQLGVKEIKAFASRELITGVHQVETNVDVKGNQSMIYDLQGREMGRQRYNLPAGVYIQNGKKVLVK